MSVDFDQRNVQARKQEGFAMDDQMTRTVRMTSRMMGAIALAATLVLACCLGFAREASAAALTTTSGVSTQAASAPAISCKSLSIQAGKTTKLKVTGGKGRVAWKTSNKAVATVSKAGKVTAKKAGSATITATKGGKRLTCAVTVAKKSSKTLVVYFSHSGTTKAAARKVQAATGGDLLRVFPKKPYTTDYDKLTNLAQKEYRTAAKPASATKALNMKQYKTVYVGFPVWWDNMPRLMQTFLGKCNLAGKAVVAFCTSGGSGIDGSMKAVRAAAKGATVLGGRDLTDDGAARVKRWVANLKTRGKASAKVPANSPSKTSASTPSETSSGASGGTSSGASADASSDAPAETPAGASGNTSAETPAEEPADTPAGTPSPSNPPGATDGKGAGATDPATPSDESGTSTRDGDSPTVIVACFSATGTTWGHAQRIAERTGADLHWIDPEQPYTAADLNYNSDCRANREQNDPSARPAIAGGAIDLTSYDAVFIGFPIWWGTCPKIIDTFIESNDLAGKTVIPFCTSGSSGIAPSVATLSSLAPEATWTEGRRLAAGASTDEVASLCI